jgi:hypothetical protein
MRRLVDMKSFEMYGKPCAIVLRVQLNDKDCLDILLPPDHIHVAGHPNSRVRDLHIPLDGTTLAAVEKGILDAEFMGF